MTEIKEKWLKALKSGEYVQGQGCLRTVATSKTGPEHCCLGVLADVIKDDINAHWDHGSFVVNATRHHGRFDCTLEGAVVVTRGGACVQTELMRMNDKYNNTFEEIADYIEKYVEVELHAKLR